MLNKFQTRIPRGKERKKLQVHEQIKKVKLNRGMTSQQVKQKIADIFSDSFTYLECDEGYLALSDQDITGEKAVNRRGALYICQCIEVNFQKMCYTL